MSIFLSCFWKTQAQAVPHPGPGEFLLGSTADWTKDKPLNQRKAALYWPVICGMACHGARIPGNRMLQNRVGDWSWLELLKTFTCATQMIKQLRSAKIHRKKPISTLHKVAITHRSQKWREEEQSHWVVAREAEIGRWTLT